MLNLSRLRMLYELSILGSISAVAASLNITRPAVSQQLALLERETGQTLFERSTKGVRLTAAGERMVRRVSELLVTVTAIEADLASDTQEIAGELRIAAFGTAASSLVPPALARLAEGNPKLRIHFTEMEPVAALRAAAAKQMDVVVAHDLLHTSAPVIGLEQQPLVADQFKAILSADHRLAIGSRKSIHLKELAEEDWALNQSAVTFSQYVISACVAEGFTPKASCNCLNIAATLEFVRTGRYVTILPALGATGIENDPDFRIIPLRPLLLRRVFCAYPRGSGDHPLVARTVEALQMAGRIFV